MFHRHHHQHDEKSQPSPVQPSTEAPPVPTPAAVLTHVKPVPPAELTCGAFAGGTYSVSHRATNSVLNLELAQGAIVHSKPGVMKHMSGWIDLRGKFKFSFKKLFSGTDITQVTYFAPRPGALALAPTLFGDVLALHLQPGQQWTVGKHALLAWTDGITYDPKAQRLSQSLFSGSGIFVLNVGGAGVLWLASFGAIDRLDLEPGQQHIVDNGHLVAWSCDYRIESAGPGPTGEGLVCRFTGPGSIYVQSRNILAFAMYVYEHSAAN